MHVFTILTIFLGWLNCLTTGRVIFQGKQVKRSSDLLESYDYIVVGGGTSGLVVANRLSEDPATTVLIIEAGKFDNNEAFTTIPIITTGNIQPLGRGARGTIYDWNLTTIPQPTLFGRSYATAAGKVIGGSSVLNSMVFNRGSEADYNRWESLGNPGWNFENLLPYFKKSEHFTPPDVEEQKDWGIGYVPEYHGQNGNLDVSFPHFVWPSSRNFVDGMTELNVPIIKDSAGGNNTGAFWYPLSLIPDDEERSTSQSFYTPNRNNLHLLTGTQVTRLAFKNSGYAGPVVTGVTYSSDGASNQTASALKEVIVAAGALHTPQLLQLSGIGDRSLLGSLGIDTLVDLPGVGANYQDHPLLITAQTVNIAIQTANFSNATWNTEMRDLYDEKKEGPYTTAGGNLVAYLPLSSYSNNTVALSALATSQDPAQYLPNNTRPTVLAGYKAQHRILVQELRSRVSITQEFLFNDGAIVPCLQTAFSRGSVTINRTSPFAPPVIDSRYLSNPLDVKLLVEGFKYTRRIRATNALQAISAFEIYPGGTVNTDEQIESFIRQTISTESHHAGTAAMLPQELGGVVNPELRVYGVKGLRVVDASIIPLLPAAHLQSTVYAIAEKAGDVILAS